MLYQMTTSILTSALLLLPSFASFSHFGSRLCQQPGYACLIVHQGEDWNILFPDSHDRQIVKKVNRMNIKLRPGMVIAVPQNLGSLDVLSVAPFPHHIHAPGKALIKVNLEELAWGAYTPEGTLMNWGPVSGGKPYCPDVNEVCTTVTGNYTILDKLGPKYVSSKYPLPKGGAPMPYGMHFYKGYAMHASQNLPGYNASHGCIRMFYEDARWLNLHFVTPGATRIQIN